MIHQEGQLEDLLTSTTDEDELMRITERLCEIADDLETFEGESAGDSYSKAKVKILLHPHI